MSRRLAFVVVLFALLAVPAGAFAAFGSSFRPVPHNPADKLVNVPIDDYAYDYAVRCLKHPQPGMVALQKWLTRHAGGVAWGIMRCEKWGRHSASLHAEGRALDWHLDVHSRRDKREAERIINLLLAPDRVGNVHALARRMGVQEVIWNCKGLVLGRRRHAPVLGLLRPQGAAAHWRRRHERAPQSHPHRAEQPRCADEDELLAQLARAPLEPAAGPPESGISSRDCAELPRAQLVPADRGLRLPV